MGDIGDNFVMQGRYVLALILEFWKIKYRGFPKIKFTRGGIIMCLVS